MTRLLSGSPGLENSFQQSKAAFGRRSENMIVSSVGSNRCDFMLGKSEDSGRASSVQPTSLGEKDAGRVSDSPGCKKMLGPHQNTVGSA